MRRLFAALLAVLLGFPPLMPLLSAETEAKLPACCRRDGKHGCSMNAKADTPGPEGVKSRKSACPLFSAAKATSPGDTGWTAPGASLRFGLVPEFRTGLEQRETKLSTPVFRQASKRGPPFA